MKMKNKARNYKFRLLWNLLFHRKSKLSTDYGLIVLVTYDSMLHPDEVKDWLLKFGFKQVLVIRITWNLEPIQFIQVDCPHLWEEI